MNLRTSWIVGNSDIGPETALDEAALRQGRYTGFRFVRTIASAMMRKYDIGEMRGLISWHQDRGCRENQKPIESL